MKKMNNKGMTLVELIVSFMIVSVAMLYFFQTLRTVQKIYKNTSNQVNDYIEMDYSLRLLATFVEQSGSYKYQDETGGVHDLNSILNNNSNYSHSIDKCSGYNIGGFNQLLCYEVTVERDGRESKKRVYFYIPTPEETSPAYSCSISPTCDPFNLEGTTYSEVEEGSNTEVENEFQEEQITSEDWERSDDSEISDTDGKEVIEGENTSDMCEDEDCE